LAAEKRMARIYILPLLQAEEDLRFLKLKEASDNAEREVMKNVPNWKVGESVYKTSWSPPHGAMRS